MKRIIAILSGSAWLMLTGMRAGAQSYAIDWYTIGDGGGASTGGSFTLDGTVGSAEAGTPLSGGTFELQGGFWPGVVMVASGVAPTLFIQLSGGSVILSWAPLTAGFQLEATDDLSSPAWSPLVGSSPITIPLGAAARFYRLTRP